MRRWRRRRPRRTRRPPRSRRSRQVSTNMRSRSTSPRSLKKRSGKSSSTTSSTTSRRASRRISRKRSRRLASRSRRASSRDSRRAHRARKVSNSCHDARRVLIRTRRRRSTRLRRPAKLAQAGHVVPDLREVFDLAVVEIHYIDIVRFKTLAGRRDRTLAGIRAPEHAKRGDVVAPLIDGKRSDFVTGVWYRRKHSLHPVRVRLDGADTTQGIRLRRKGRVRSAVALTSVPAFAALARIEKF